MASELQHLVIGLPKQIMDSFPSQNSSSSGDLDVMTTVTGPSSSPKLDDGGNHHSDEKQETCSTLGSPRRSDGFANDIEEHNSYHFIIIYEEKKNSIFRQNLLAFRQCNTFSLPKIIAADERTVQPNDVLPCVTSWNGDTKNLVLLCRKIFSIDLYIVDSLWRNSEYRYNREEIILLCKCTSSTVPNCFVPIPFGDVSTCNWEIGIPNLDILSVINRAINNINTTQLNRTVPEWRVSSWINDIKVWLEVQTVKPNSKNQSLSTFRVERPEIEQLTNTFYSTVCLVKQVSTDAKDNMICYLKCSSTHIPEAHITLTLAGLFPSYIPRVISVKNDHTFLQEKANISNFSDNFMLQSLADLQITSITHTDSLVGCGIPNRDTNWHLDNLTETFSFEDTILHEEHERKLRDCLTRLASFNIPNTLVHGDFHKMNVVEMPRTNGFGLIDWATANVGHPFVDFIRITEIEWDCIDDKEALERYLSRWRVYESESNIHEALKLAALVMFLSSMVFAKKMCQISNGFERKGYFQTYQNAKRELLSELGVSTSSSELI